MKPDLRVARCLLRLQGEEFAPWRDYLTALTRRDMTHLVHTADAAQVGRLQGRLQATTELLELIENAKLLAEKLDR